MRMSNGNWTLIHLEDGGFISVNISSNLLEFIVMMCRIFHYAAILDSSFKWSIVASATETTWQVPRLMSLIHLNTWHVNQFTKVNMNKFEIINIMFTFKFFVPPILNPSPNSLPSDAMTNIIQVDLISFSLSTSPSNGRTVVTSYLSTSVYHTIISSSTADRGGVHQWYFRSPWRIWSPTWGQLHADPHRHPSIAHPLELPPGHPVAWSVPWPWTLHATARSFTQSRPQLSVTSLSNVTFLHLHLLARAYPKPERDAWQWDQFSPSTKKLSAAAVFCVFGWWIFTANFCHEWNQTFRVYHHSECFEICKLW